MGTIIIATIYIMSSAGWTGIGVFQVDNINFADKEISRLEDSGYEVLATYEHVVYIIPQRPTVENESEK
jgi:hypothetical protein